MPKRTFQPNNRRRAKKHGFRARMATKNGRAVLASSRERAQSINAETLLTVRFVLPKESRIAKSAEFRLVYGEGKRFDGRFMTLFLRPTTHEFHRLGVTASKKGIGKAIERNRAKRLLREAFRLSKIELDDLSNKYDWVLNARRNLLKVKLEKPLCDFRRLIEAVKNSEIELSKGDRDVNVK